MFSAIRASTALAATLAVAMPGAIAHAQDSSQSEVQELKSEVRSLKDQVAALTALVKQTLPKRALKAARGGNRTSSRQVVQTQGNVDLLANSVPPSQIAPAARPPSPTTQETAPLASGANAGPTTLAQGHGNFERKKGPTATFYVPGGEVTGYGNFDVSFDVVTKGLGSAPEPGGVKPVGRLGWLPDVATNLSYIGVRGFEKIPGQNINFVYQLETQIDIAASSGVSENNSAQSNVVKGGLTSRNSYIGLSSDEYGAILFGKTDAPYKQSTARLNPFIGMIGDYAAIMGNTGGDNRVEFGTRLDHSIWYVSPTLAGFQLTALYSPGQNTSANSDNIAAGESDCTGGNIPGSGGSLPYACNDGSFSDAFSASLTYTNGPLYIAAAYERHEKVNRSSDLTGEYANPPTTYFNGDTADEDAAKIGAQYTFPTRTTIGAIFEDLHRYVPSFLEFQNERQRTGYWLEGTQLLTPADSISAGWAHADRTPGDPGQHNSSLELPPLGAPGDGTGGAHVNNSSNLFTVGYIHNWGAGLSSYFDWATIFNGSYAHYALGAGGRSITYDCHDASDATGDETSNPHCWAGAHPQGVSVGLRYRF